ncbi:MAG: hypothetical protein B7Z47_06065 [Chthoniobacter sp. 12-60-6]|nr:MAG: hypothetical protein B7Z47_06065 [Chthoniobacter sp. 12-60-6]
MTGRAAATLRPPESTMSSPSATTQSSRRGHALVTVTRTKRAARPPVGTTSGSPPGFGTSAVVSSATISRRAKVSLSATSTRKRTGNP